MKKWTKRRTWKKTSVKKVGESFQIYLDDRALLTPKKTRLCLPTRKLAVKVVEEWDQHEDFIDPSKIRKSKNIEKDFDNCREEIKKFSKEFKKKFF